MHRANLSRTVLGALLVGMPLATAACTGPAPNVQPLYVVNGEAQTLETDELHERGVAQLKRGRIGLALQDLRLALHREPRSVATLNAIAVCYDELGRFDVSKAYYQRALSLAPSLAQTLNNLARSLIRQGHNAKALAYLERAAAQDDGNEIVLANLETARAGLTGRSGRAPVPSRTEANRDSLAVPVLPAWVERTSPKLQTLVFGHYSKANGHNPSPAGARAVSYRPATEPATRPHRVKGSPSGRLSLEPAPTSGKETFSIEVSNGTGRRLMASRVAGYLAASGFPQAWLTNAETFRHERSVIFFRPGYLDVAERLARALAADIHLAESADQAADLRFRLGGDLLAFDRQLLIASKEDN